jgi:3-deoxy-D-manno-octulosonic-acid transferase
MPSTLFALLLFLCFITPGLVFEILQERSRPARQYTALRETSIIVIASVAFALPAAIIILLVRVAARSWFPDFSELATRPAQYSASHLPQVIGFIVELIVLAVGFAWITDRVIRRRHPPHAVIRNNPTWFEMLDGQVRPDDTKAVIVSAELKNGASIQGAVKAHESGKDQALAWLVLQPHSAM